MATHRVRLAGPSLGRRGRMRMEEGERSMVMGYLRRVLGVATIRAQCLSLLGRVESLGPGTAAATARRKEAAELDRRWRLEQQAYDLSVRQGWSIYRTGFGKNK